MSVKVMTLVWDKAPYQGNTLITMLALADWSNDEGVSWPSVFTLAQKTRQSERNAQLCLDRMKTDGFLSTQIRKGTSSLYKLSLKKLKSCEEYTPPKSNRGGNRGGCNVCTTQTDADGGANSDKGGCKQIATFAPNTLDQSGDTLDDTCEKESETNHTEDKGMSVVNRLKKAAEKEFGRREPDNHIIWDKVKKKFKFSSATELQIEMSFYDWATTQNKTSLRYPVSAFMGEADEYVAKQEETAEAPSAPDIDNGQKLFIHICKASKGGMIPDAKQQKQLAQAAGMYPLDLLTEAFDSFLRKDRNDFEQSRATKTFCDGIIGLAELQISLRSERKRTEEALKETETKSRELLEQSEKEAAERERQDAEEAKLADEMEDLMGFGGGE